MLSPAVHFGTDDAAFFSAFVIRNQQANVVWLEGVVDLTSQPTLAATTSMLRFDPKPITIDLSRVTFGDCTLAAFIADLAQRHSVQLREPSRLVSDLVTVAGLSRCPPSWDGIVRTATMVALAAAGSHPGTPS